MPSGASCQIASTTTPTTSNCWSGYVEQGTTYSSVSAQWTVPSVAVESSSSFYADSTWVGVGGWNNGTLIQAGTSEESYDGALYYFVWDENLPNQPTEQYEFAVNPGDTISASISLSSGSTWNISVVDETSCAFGSCQADNQTESYAGSTASAEFIQEAPSSSGDVLPLDPYQEFAFAGAGINGGAAALSASQQVTMPGLSAPSVPSPAANAFNMEYGGSVPPPPSAPGAPTIGTARSLNRASSVAFTRPANDGGSPITNYTAICTSSNGGVTGSRSWPGSPVTVPGLTNGKAYTCVVIATNAIGTSLDSTASNRVIPATVPLAPLAAKATSGSTVTGTGTLTVSYTAGADNGAVITKFTATCVSSNGGTTRAAVHNGAVAALITVGNLSTNKSYRCTVSATNARGTSPLSALSVPVTVGAPAEPRKPTVSRIGAGHLKVAFTTPANNGAPITSLNAVCRSSNGGTTNHKAADANPLGVTGLTPGKTYTCTVTATNDRGTGPSSTPSAAVSV